MSVAVEVERSERETEILVERFHDDTEVVVVDIEQLIGSHAATFLFEWLTTFTINDILQRQHMFKSALSLAVSQVS